MTRLCEHCSNPIVNRARQAKFCSKRCYIRAKVIRQGMRKTGKAALRNQPEMRVTGDVVEMVENVFSLPFHHFTSVWPQMVMELVCPEPDWDVNTADVAMLVHAARMRYRIEAGTVPATAADDVIREITREKFGVIGISSYNGEPASAEVAAG